MKAKKEDLVSGGIVGFLILCSAVVIFQMSGRYSIVGGNPGAFRQFVFFNWWGILAAAVALFYGLSKTVYTENRLWKYGILILSAMLLIYAVISLLLWII
ncbi:hypothetical protein [Zhenpiania hominis]|uniref:Uncharacterized protein n=1 Tax=Zhenpiania hominis TaxID=2763644 RepID=A0A923NJN4_9FIRM|nr:hypothetical protein [Zhenpiania hominis]MBC6680326.1 hypothetical protein [Zhenpiania hominis]